MLVFGWVVVLSPMVSFVAYLGPVFDGSRLSGLLRLLVYGFRQLCRLVRSRTELVERDLFVYDAVCRLVHSCRHLGFDAGAR